jgi:hypothetical protein
MIKNLDGKNVKVMPHNNEYRAWKKKLSVAEFEAVADEIDKLVEASAGKFVPSWQDIDWEGPVFKPLVTACGGDKTVSGLFYGLICWDIIQQRSEDWTFTKFEKGGKEFSIYFLATP